MIISAVKAELILPGATSLKAKRGPLKSLISKIRNQFNCSVVEADFHDLHQRASLLVAFAAQDRVQSSRLENSLEELLQNNADFILSRYEKEYFSV